jgi:hypothetical protein
MDLAQALKVRDESLPYQQFILILEAKQGLS